MRIRHCIVSTLLVCVSACSGPPNGANMPPALVDVWVGLDSATETLSGLEGNPCETDFGTWFHDFGARGLACIAGEVMDPVALIARAGGSAFDDGPHVATSESFRLDLTNERSFGHYSEDFVEWLIDNGIVGEGRPVIRALTQPIYDEHIRRLARIYWLTYEDMAADGFPRSTPAGILSDYARFLEGGPIPNGVEGYEGGFSVYAFTDLSEGLLPRLDVGMINEWEAKYEANTAYGFWLRRRADGTQEQWRDGLERMLETYDAAWYSER